MFSALPAEVLGPALSERESIADVCYRSILSIDHNDEKLLLSALTDDVYAEIGDETSTSMTQTKTIACDRVAALDTTHFISNMRTSIERSTTATATCSTLAQLTPAGKGF
ncbi:hypothetical protein S40288_10121 [Stachybotrys chartarum IBT 40288]|nr:hypothetical protein S40288_10121 [Stachybotrys chartarum IBT 40288]